MISWDRSLIGRAGYYIRLAVNPQNPDDVFVMSSSLHRSQDGGKTFSGNGGAPFPFTQGQASCGDCHDVWIDPKDPVRYALVDDGGANINTRQGIVRVSLPNGQMYHVHVDTRVPYWIYSNRQDDGTMRGPMTVSEQTGNGRLPAGSTMPQPVAGGRGGRGGGAAPLQGGAVQRERPRVRPRQADVQEARPRHRNSLPRRRPNSSSRRHSAVVEVEVAVEAVVCSGSRTSADASPGLPSPIPPMPTSSTRRVTATKSPGGMRGLALHVRSSRG